MEIPMKIEGVKTYFWENLLGLFSVGGGILGDLFDKI